MKWFFLVSGIVLLSGIAACGTSGPPEPHTLAFSHIVDLSHVVTPDMPQKPGESRTQIFLPHSSDGPTALHLSLPSTTYLSIPTATSSDVTVDRMSPRNLILPAVVLDMRDPAGNDPAYLLTVSEIRAWERRYGRIPADSMVILNTGWDNRWDRPDEYLNLDANEVPQVPGFSSAAIEFLLHKRQVNGLGIDTPDIGGSSSHAENPAVSHLLAEQLLLENLTNLEQLPPTGTNLVISGMKIQSGTGSPVSVLAFVP
jgi:kynurenine formamidase